MQPKVGQTLTSTVDDTTVIVVRAPTFGVDITCGGAAMVDAKAAGAGGAGTPDPDQQAGTALGKRYAAEDVGLELLCTKPGLGTLAVNGTPLPLKAAKALPASD